MQFAIGDIVCIDPLALTTLIESGEWRDVPLEWLDGKDFLCLLSQKSWKIATWLPSYSNEHFPDEDCWRIVSMDDKLQFPDCWQHFDIAVDECWYVPNRILAPNNITEADRKLLMEQRFDKIRQDMHVMKNM